MDKDEYCPLCRRAMDTHKVRIQERVLADGQKVVFAIGWTCPVAGPQINYDYSDISDWHEALEKAIDDVYMAHSRGQHLELVRTDLITKAIVERLEREVKTDGRTGALAGKA